jgi:uncharacterized protein YegP (UPF0339 family)
MATTKKPYTVAVYQDRAGGWRWRMKAPNGRIVADSAESYVRRRTAERAALKLVGVEILVAMPRAAS